jgi:hypothetical protein
MKVSLKLSTWILAGLFSSLFVHCSCDPLRPVSQQENPSISTLRAPNPPGAKSQRNVAPAPALKTPLNLQPDKKCEVPGHAIQWMAAICFQQVSSNNLRDLGVQTCIQDLTSSLQNTTLDACSVLFRLKRDWCLLHGVGMDAAEACVKDGTRRPDPVSGALR